MSFEQHGYLASVGGQDSSGLSSHWGSAPAPFDALDGNRLAGPSGSHPLAGITPEALLRATTDGFQGGIELGAPARVGEAITGTIRARATRDFQARSTGIRLVGVLIAEERRSRTETTTGADGQSSSKTEDWVEVSGRVIEDLTFTDAPLPASVVSGQVLEIPFSIPAPRLGPPSAHAGCAIVAWAVEAHWDIQRDNDERISVLVPVAQHPDLLRAGVINLPSGAMFDSVADGDASLSVVPLPPLRAGAPVTLSVAWPGAPGGRSARVELTTDVEAANGTTVVSVSLPVDQGALGGLQVAVPLPADLPPTLETAGLRVGHRLRVIVDRKLRSDVAVERPIVVT